MRLKGEPEKGDLCADHIASRTRSLAFEACHAEVSEDVRSQINGMVHLMHEMNHRTPSRSRTSAKKGLSLGAPSRLISLAEPNSEEKSFRKLVRKRNELILASRFPGYTFGAISSAVLICRPAHQKHPHTLFGE